MYDCPTHSGSLLGDRPHRTIAVAVLSLLLWGTERAPAQALYGSLAGRVSDASAAPVTDAVATLVHRDTQATVSAKSDHDGTYRFPRVAPGRYTLTIEKDGFRQEGRSGIVVAVNQHVELDVTLELGEVRESVDVQAETPLVQARSAEVSGLVDEQRVRELPLNGENFQRLMLLAPGVSGGAVNNPAVSGARPVTNSYTLDGSTFNDERGAGGGLAIGGGAADFGAGSPNLVSTEAIREFRVITSNADATFGRGSGAQINVVTRAGSNGLDGSAYYYGRNDALDARDFFNSGPFFDDRGRAVTPPFEQHLYGTTLGGPIARDRHFFFGSFEGFRQKLEQTASATVPNAALIGQIPGDLRTVYESFYIGQGIVPPSGNPFGSFSPLPAAARTAAVAAGFAQALFDGNTANDEAGTVLLSTANTRNVTQDSVLVRTDHRLSNRLQASIRYAFAKPDLDSNTRAVTGSLIETRRRWQSAVAQALWTVSPTQILEIRGGVLQSRRRDTPQQEIDPELLALGVTPEYGLRSRVNGTALSLLEIPPGLGGRDNQTVPNLSVSHTWNRNKLTLRSGLDVRHTDVDVLVVSNVSFYNFNGFVGPTGVLGTVAGQPQAVAGETVATLYGVPEGPATPDRRWRSTEQEYFIQADYAIRQNLTFNLGLRYSYFGVYSEATGAGGESLRRRFRRKHRAGCFSVHVWAHTECDGAVDEGSPVVPARSQQRSAARWRRLEPGTATAHGGPSGVRRLRRPSLPGIVGLRRAQLSLRDVAECLQSAVPARGSADCRRAYPDSPDRPSAREPVHAPVQYDRGAATRRAHERQRRLRRRAQRQPVSVLRAECAGGGAPESPAGSALCPRSTPDQRLHLRVRLPAAHDAPAVVPRHRHYRRVHVGPRARRLSVRRRRDDGADAVALECRRQCRGRIPGRIAGSMGRSAGRRRLGARGFRRAS